MKKLLKWVKDKLDQLDQVVEIFNHRYDYKKDLTIDRYGKEFELHRDWYNGWRSFDAFDIVKDIFRQHVEHGWSGKLLLGRIKTDLTECRWSYDFSEKFKSYSARDKYIDRLYIENTGIKLKPEEVEKPVVKTPTVTATGTLTTKRQYKKKKAKKDEDNDDSDKELKELIAEAEKFDATRFNEEAALQAETIKHKEAQLAQSKVDVSYADALNAIAENISATEKKNDEVSTSIEKIFENADDVPHVSHEDKNEPSFESILTEDTENTKFAKKLCLDCIHHGSCIIELNYGYGHEGCSYRYEHEDCSLKASHPPTQISDLDL